MSSRGRVYRRCACRGQDGRQLSTACPKLAASSRHGTWAFAVDMPSTAGKRTTHRRAGFTSKGAAAAELTKLPERGPGGVVVDDVETVGAFLTSWLAEKSRVLKPTTAARYRDYVQQGSRAGTRHGAPRTAHPRARRAPRRRP